MSPVIGSDLPDQNGWNEWSRYVLKTLEEVRGRVDVLADKIAKLDILVSQVNHRAINDRIEAAERRLEELHDRAEKSSSEPLPLWGTMALKLSPWGAVVALAIIATVWKAKGWSLF